MTDRGSIKLQPTPGADALSIYAALLRGELEGDQALQASQQMFRLVTDTIPQAVWWKDTDCVFLGCNAYLANMAGLQPEDFIGKTDREMPWGGSEEYGADWYQAHDRQVMESGVPEYGIREQIQKLDGSVAWIQTNKVPLRDLDGNVIGVLGTFEDITDRIRAEEELQMTLNELDERVQARTSALRHANEALRRQVEERARIEAQERRHRSYAETLRDTAATLSRSLDLDEVLEEALIGMRRLVPYHLGAVVLAESDGNMALARTIHDEARNVPVVEPGDSVDHLDIAGWIKAWDGPTIHNNVRKGCIGSSSRSVLGTPIAVGGTLLGYLVAESVSPRFFSTEHVDGLRAVADLAASAIANAQQFSTASELAILEERQRLARELHDAVSQTLWTANIVADSMDPANPPEVAHDQLSRLRMLTRGALADMRSLLHELRPASLTDTPLGQLIEQLADAFRGRKSVAVHVTFPSAGVPELPPHRKFAFYRIAQEALNNVGRHAAASRVDIDVSTDEHAVTLSIHDDGQGFEESEAAGMGLGIMRERAARADVTLRISSELGVGTKISMSAPLAEAS